MRYTKAYSDVQTFIAAQLSIFTLRIRLNRMKLLTYKSSNFIEFNLIQHIDREMCFLCKLSIKIKREDAFQCRLLTSISPTLGPLFKLDLVSHMSHGERVTQEIEGGYFIHPSAILRWTSTEVGEGGGGRFQLSKNYPINNSKTNYLIIQMFVNYIKAFQWHL